MRKRKDDTGLFFPFGLSTCYKVVNCDCGSIGKISKLSLPDDKTVGVGDGISVFEAKNTVLTQVTVGDSDIVGDRFQEDVFFDISFLVANESVTVRESTSLYILS